MSEQNTPIEGANLEALAQPEGGYVPEIHDPVPTSDPTPGVPTGDEPTPTGGELGVNDLPNLDNDPTLGTQQIVNNDPVPDPAPTPDPTIDTPSANGQHEPGNPFVDNIASRIKERFGEDALNQIEGGLTEENAIDVLEQFNQIESQQSAIHPELARIQEAIDNGADINNIFSQIKSTTSLESMDARTVVGDNLKERFGWEDDKVSKTLDNMENSGMLEIEKERVVAENKQTVEQIAQQEAYRAQEAQQKEYQQITQDREAQLDDTYKVIDETNSILGMEVSQADKPAFKEAFREMITPDQTGMAPLMRQLQSNETLMRVAYALWRGDSGFKSQISNIKEGVKDSYMNRLDPEPRTPNKSGQHDPGAINMDALTAPEQLRF